MEIITSMQNQLVKETKKLQQRKYREETKLFLIEGVRLTEEALQAGVLETVFYTENVFESERGRTLLNLLMERYTESISLYQVTPQVLKILTETESPQGIMGVARQKNYNLGQMILPESALILVVDTLQDPGNLGTMIRTAWCAGVDAVVCLPGTVDPYNGKTVRASMGGIFNVSVITGVEWGDVRAWCQEQRLQLVAGGLHGQEHFALDYSNRVSLVIGNEGQGLTQVLPEQVDANVTIPLAQGAESLNAAVACGVLVYEIMRQRHVTS